MQVNDEMISIMQGREVIYASMSELFLNLIEEKHLKMLEDLMPMYKEMAENSDNKDIIYGVEHLIDFIKGYQDSDKSHKKL